jgi:hypothetical protein
MIGKILDQEMNERDRIEMLKAESGYYPKVLMKSFVEKEETGKSRSYASTLVRIKRNGLWYKIHCLESQIVPREDPRFDFLLLRLMQSVYQIQKLYKIAGTGNDELDLNQISEKDRLRIDSIKESSYQWAELKKPKGKLSNVTWIENGVPIPFEMSQAYKSGMYKTPEDYISPFPPKEPDSKEGLPKTDPYVEIAKICGLHELPGNRYINTYGDLFTLTKYGYQWMGKEQTAR